MRHYFVICQHKFGDNYLFIITTDKMHLVDSKCAVFLTKTLNRLLIDKQITMVSRDELNCCLATGTLPVRQFVTDNYKIISMCFCEDSESSIVDTALRMASNSFMNILSI